MNVRNDNRWGQLDDASVAAFEARNGIELPPDYRAFLLSHHGGVPVPDFYWVVPGDWGSGIESLYGFGPDGYRLQQYLDGRESLRISVDLLPIGDDGCCNYLCLGVSGPRRGQVVYIDHEFEPGETERERRLAGSFTEFLASLCASPGG
jgi:hypothetical protein